MKRIFLPLALLPLLATLTLATDATIPNIVFIFADDWGWRDHG